MTLEVYVTKTNGTSYCEAEFEDDAEGRREADRFAWGRMAADNVVSVQVKRGSSGGFTRRRGTYR